MDTTYLPAIAALVGSAIGGFTSLATTWINQYGENRSRHISQERQARETLFGQFIDEATLLFADALTHNSTDLTRLGKLYGLISRMRLFAPADIVQHADIVTQKIIDTYLAPNVTFEHIRSVRDNKTLEPLWEFSEACRNELGRFRA
jgi:hypothetical protein